MSNNSPLAVIFGIEGLSLTSDEVALIRDLDPFGFILFARNIDTPDQVRSLTSALRETVGRVDAPILIDQEGGRVRRLRPPYWREAPPTAVFGALYARDRDAGRLAVRLNTQLIAHELTDLGIDTDCLPMLDVRYPSAHDIVGDRAFSDDVDVVTELGLLQMEALLESGVYPVIKHIPGHGRALADSHDALPEVPTSRAELEATDFRPFIAARHAPFGMTAHIVYTDLDPELPATLSPRVVSEVIRGTCGFDGLLMTDDLSMKALYGSMEARTRQSLEAGCDLILHCNGKMDEMEAVASAAHPMTDIAMDRWARAKTLRAERQSASAAFDPGDAQARLEGLLALREAV